MTKTRILFCDHNMDIAGGQRSVLALIDSIDRSEFDLYAAVPAGATKLIEELGKRSVSVVPLGLKRRDRMRKRHFFRAFDLAGSVWDAGLSAVRIATVCRRRRIDIIHANTIAAALIASLARFFTSFKLAVRIRSGLVYSNHGVLDFFMLSMADVILCNSHYVRGTIATRLAGAPAGFRNKTHAKAYVVYNPLPCARGARRRGTANRRLCATDGLIWALSAASPQENNSMSRLMRSRCLRLKALTRICGWLETQVRLTAGVTPVMLRNECGITILPIA